MQLKYKVLTERAGIPWSLQPVQLSFTSLDYWERREYDEKEYFLESEDSDHFEMLIFQKGFLHESLLDYRKNSN